MLNILVCNDDGVNAPGIHNLVEAASAFGKITVVAPDSPQSGMGHAISLGKLLRLNKVQMFGDIPAYECSGTPVDCVKLGVGVLKLKPDLILSGINHGANTSISVFYSGTMSAAMEGAIEGVPSMAFSLDSFSYDADFSGAKKVVQLALENFVQFGMAKGTALNINIPNIAASELKGIKICRQAKGRFVEEFDERTDPYGRKYYWLTGRFRLDDQGEDTDIHAIENGYASVVPVETDATAHHLMANLNQWRHGFNA